VLLADTTCDGLEDDIHEDVARLRRLRDALRRLAAELTDDPRPPRHRRSPTARTRSRR